ncbi:hypothetical protein SKAU_G00061560 [Synaphobranchus kaupii]|uniref:DDE Tnp4 domain-containing protein n=1 Tax=Synaphobranchus kaupii TaxID=118154 RepID=A0A9Q1G5U8_SYNKA|nr:hypothetical protein SKAU_G00061560 [Synaphobranchus kaupii]
MGGDSNCIALEAGGGDCIALEAGGGDCIALEAGGGDCIALEAGGGDYIALEAGDGDCIALEAGGGDCIALEAGGGDCIALEAGGGDCIALEAGGGDCIALEAGDGDCIALEAGDGDCIALEAGDGDCRIALETGDGDCFVALGTGSGGRILALETGSGIRIIALEAGGGNGLLALGMGVDHHIIALERGGGDRIIALGTDSGDRILALETGSGNRIIALETGGDDHLLALETGGGDRMIALEAGGGKGLLALGTGDDHHIIALERGGGDRIIALGTGSRDRILALEMGSGNSIIALETGGNDHSSDRSSVGSKIYKINTNYREAISPAERLCICLRFLATGDSYRSIAFSYRVGFSTVVKIVREVCEVLWTSLVEEYMPVPGKEEWKEIAEDFQTLWDFPNCVGAIDGKHVAIQAPSNSGSLYHNYKGTFSIVLLAVVDARYRFRVVDIGAYGKSSDGGTLVSSSFGQALLHQAMDLPADKPLPGAEEATPYVFVGDEAFPLRRCMMRPFPGQRLSPEQRIFNYRLSRARRMVECAFGILASQWRLYRRVLGVSPEVAEVVVKATCILHNFIRWHSADEEDPSSTVMNLESSTGMQDISRLSSNNTSRDAIAVREKFTAYFSSPTGEVPWQHTVV